MEKKIGIWVGAVLTALIIVVGISVLQSQGPSEGDATLAQILSEVTPKSLEPTELDHKKGDEEADVVIIEYSDFQCPFCAQYYPIIDELANNEDVSIQVVYRNLPLVTLHRNALAASRAAEAASNQGKFWEMHDKLFQTQPDWSTQSVTDVEESFVGYATELGLDGERFRADMNGEGTLRAVAADMAAANQLEIQSTPSFVVNGNLIDVNTLEEFSAEIAKALDEASQE